MPSSNSIKQLIELWGFISKSRQKQYKTLLILMGLSSALEMIGVGAVIPFIGVLVSPETVYANPHFSPYITLLSIKSPHELILPITISFMLVTIFVIFLKFYTNIISIRVTNATGGDLSVKMYNLILHQPYSFHLNNNSSQQINLITQKANLLSTVLLTSASIISGLFSLLAIMIALFYISFWISLVLIGMFSIIYVCAISITKRRLLINSKIIAGETTNVIRSLQDGLGGIRDIIIDKKQSVYCEMYKNADTPMRVAHGNSAIISSSPKYAIELFSIISLVLITYLLSRQSQGLSGAMPVLGAFAMGAQRLMPIAQGIYTGWASIRSNYASCQESIDLLKLEPLEIQGNIDLLARRSNWEIIKFKNVDFSYNIHSPRILKNINLEISRGDCIGIIGSSGSGKSTLLDLIMGLLNPTKGNIEIDGRRLLNEEVEFWQSKLAHIPQTIFLSDSTIIENIAFGVPLTEIDMVRLENAVRKAHLSDVISKLKDGYKSKVGERGIKLSGGQRQRIGIARALYKNVDVLIFDEATNALDLETERSVMDAINTLRDDFTIIIVAHRINTLYDCSKIIELKNGEIIFQGKYSELSGRAL